VTPVASFDLALPYVLAHEGKWSFDSADPGGATNYGITLETAKRYGIQDAEELMAITPEKVAQIYKDGYWIWGGVDDQRVATKLFDMGVNMGVRSAVRLLQDGLNTLGAFLEVDGKLGPKTLASTNAVTPEHMLNVLCYESAEHYKAIVAHRPESIRFLKGWLKRAEEKP